MPLYDPPATPRLSRAEFDYTALTRPTGFGEYLGSALRQGWDISGVGAFARDPFGASQRFGPLPTGQDLETSKAMGFDVDLPRLTEEQWQQAGLAREGLAYEGGTLDHERSRTDEFDRKRYHDSVVARYQGNVLAYAAGFGARVVGGGLSPENFIPFVGPGMRAAMITRLGVIGGHAAVGTIDNVIGTALTDAYVMPQLAREGETVTAGDFAMDLVLGAAAGTVLGSAGGWLERRRVAANAIRTPGVEPMADALDRASEALDTGTPVDVGGYIRSTDTVQRMERMEPELTGEGPATLTEARSIFAAEAETHADRFLEVFNAAKSGDILELPMGRYQVNVSKDGTRRTLMQLDDEGNATGIIYSADEGKTGAAVYLGRDMAAAAGERPEARAPGEAVEQPTTPRQPDALRSETIGRGEFVAGHETGGVLNLGRAAAALTERVGKALAAGAQVTLFADGRPVQITSIINGMMADASGHRWGTAILATSTGPENSVRIDHAPKAAPRPPDLTTTATPEPPEPSVVAAETTYKVVPPDFTAEQAARIKESGLDAESFARDQAAIQQARKQGALTAAQEAELEAGELAAKAHEEEALAHEAMMLCASRYD